MVSFIINEWNAKVSKEQARAIRALEKAMSMWNHHLVRELPDISTLCVTGSIFTTTFLISNSFLPKGTDWGWNQSRRRQSLVDTTNSIDCSFYKINPRRGKQIGRQTPLPDWKMWIYTFETRPGIVNGKVPKAGSILWVERGISVNYEMKNLRGPRTIIHNSNLRRSEPNLVSEPSPSINLVGMTQNVGDYALPRLLQQKAILARFYMEQMNPLPVNAMTQHTTPRNPTFPQEDSSQVYLSNINGTDVFTWV